PMPPAPPASLSLPPLPPLPPLPSLPPAPSSLAASVLSSIPPSGQTPSTGSPSTIASHSARPCTWSRAPVAATRSSEPPPPDPSPSTSNKNEKNPLSPTARDALRANAPMPPSSPADTPQHRATDLGFLAPCADSALAGWPIRRQAP